MTDLIALADRVDALTSSDNAIDVLIEVALFEPDYQWAAIRANAAGTKLIYTRPEGKEETYRAIDWTDNEQSRAKAAAALRARSRLCDKCKEFALPGKTVCAECGE